MLFPIACDWRINTGHRAQMERRARQGKGAEGARNREPKEKRNRDERTMTRVFAAVKGTCLGNHVTEHSLRSWPPRRSRRSDLRGVEHSLDRETKCSNPREGSAMSSTTVGRLAESTHLSHVT